MTEQGVGLNPGSGGTTARVFRHTASSRDMQFVTTSDYRGGFTFVASSGLITATAVASQQLWHFLNPTGSGKTAYVHRITSYGFNSGAAALIPVRLVRTTATVPTGGSTITAVRTDGTGTPANVGIPRLGGSGFLMTGITAVAGSIGTNIMPLTAGAYQVANMFDDDRSLDRDLVVAAGSGLMIDAVGTPNAAHRLIVDIMWEEL